MLFGVKAIPSQWMPISRHFDVIWRRWYPEIYKGLRKFSLANLAATPSSSSILSSWLYLARRSDLQGAPVLICPLPRPTTRSAMKQSSVSPERWETMVPQPEKVEVVIVLRVSAELSKSDIKSSNTNIFAWLSTSRPVWPVKSCQMSIKLPKNESF